MINDEQNAPTVVDDLTVDENTAQEVKGGAEIPFYLKLTGVDGDVTHTAPGTPSISEIVPTKGGN